MMQNRLIALLFAMSMPALPAAAAEPVVLHAAGSLRSALTETAAAYEKTTAGKVQAKFGPSGTLKEEIAGGQRPKCLPPPTWNIHWRWRKQIKPDRWHCLRATGFAR